MLPRVEVRGEGEDEEVPEEGAGVMEEAAPDVGPDLHLTPEKRPKDGGVTISSREGEEVCARVGEQLQRAEWAEGPSLNSLSAT